MAGTAQELEAELEQVKKWIDSRPSDDAIVQWGLLVSMYNRDATVEERAVSEGEAEQMASHLHNLASELRCLGMVGKGLMSLGYNGESCGYSLTKKGEATVHSIRRMNGGGTKN